jgi:hypothetical protein
MKISRRLLVLNLTAYNLKSNTSSSLYKIQLLNTQHRYSYTITLGQSLRILAINFDIQYNIQFTRRFGAVHNVHGTPVPPRQKMFVVQCLPIHIFHEEGNHVFVCIGVQVVHLVPSVS